MSRILLYNCTDDRKKVRKSPTLLAEVNMQIKQPTNVVNPVVILSNASFGKNWSKINYAYIPDFGRYYFVDNVELRHDGVLSLTMTTDVLYTYKDTLLNTKFMIARSESLNSPWYIDTEKALIQRRIVSYKKIGEVPQSTSGAKFAITVAGG